MIHLQPGEDGTEAFIATATAIGLAIAAGTATSSVIAASKQAGAAHESAQLQSASADKALTAQTQANKEALDFQKSQAAQDLITHNATAKANYDQWAARERRISSLGSALGLAPRDIPAFVPTPGPTDAPTGAPAAQSGLPQVSAGDLTPPGPNATPDQIGHYVASYFASRGVQPAPTSVNYFVQKWPELVARGQELNDPQYPFKRLAAADEFGGGGGAAPSAAAVPANLTQAARFTPAITGPYTPALQAPQVGTLSSYARGMA